MTRPPDLLPLYISHLSLASLSLSVPGSRLLHAWEHVQQPLDAGHLLPGQGGLDSWLTLDLADPDSPIGVHLELLEVVGPSALPHCVEDVVPPLGELEVDEETSIRKLPINSQASSCVL